MESSRLTLAQSQHHTNTEDPNVYIYSGSSIQRTATTILLILITILLMLPIVICNVVHMTIVRLIIVILSTSFYLVVLSTLTKSKTAELVVAGATYDRAQSSEQLITR